MKVTTLIPTVDNKGHPVDEAIIEELLQGLARQFSGCSTDGMVDGRSVDRGKSYRDKSLRVTIVCDNQRLWESQAAIIEIGRKLGQVSMYFEVRDYDGVQFLNVNDEQQPDFTAAQIDE